MAFLCPFGSKAATIDVTLHIGPAIAISFDTEHGKIYEIQSSPALSPATWTRVGSIIKGRGSRFDTALLARTAEMRFFRVEMFDENAGLVAYYPFTGNANDESGNPNHGTIYGANLTSDRFGNPDSAYRFDGTNAYIELPESTAFDSPVYSISLWFKPEQYPAEASMLFSKGQNNFEIHTGSELIGQTAMKFLPRFNGPSAVMDWHTPIGIYKTNVWQHCVAIYNPSEGFIRFFVNAQEVPLSGPAATSAAGDNSIPARIGMRTDGTLGFQGCLDDLRIYNRSLAPTEIQMIYAESNINVNEGLIAYYPFNGYAIDESGNGRHLTINGATLTTDRFGNANRAFQFDGINDSLVGAIPDLPVGAAARSVSLWARVNPNPSKGVILLDWGLPESLKPYAIMCNGSPYVWTIATYGGENGFASDVAVDNNWHHIAAVYTGSSHRMFVDGALVGTLDEAIVTVLTELRIGYGTTADDAFFAGAIDDVRLYDRALTDTEVGSVFLLRE